MSFKDLIAGKKKIEEDKEPEKFSIKEEKTAPILPLEVLKNLRSDLKSYLNQLPKLNEKQEILEKEIDGMQEKLAKTEDSIQELTTLKNTLEDSMKDKLTELQAIENIKGILGGLA